MKEIRLFNVELTVEDETFLYEDNEWMDDINIPKEIQVDILRNLMCFHYLDLTEAYGGKKVEVRLVPVEEDEPFVLEYYNAM